MIAAALLCARLATATSEPTPTPGDCTADPESLRAEAEELLAAAGFEPDADALSRARNLLRRARRRDSSAPLALEAADLAFAAGDEEEGCDLLAAADDGAPGSLTAPELLRLGRRAAERQRWAEAIRRYDELSRRLALPESADWIHRLVQQLEVEKEASAILPPSSGPSPEARLALADGKRDLAAGRWKEARESLRTAIDLSPGYVEALLALAGLEARTGRPKRAIALGREALGAEPERVETLTLLSNLLWEQPDRRAKEESLALLDRASSSRPDLRSLLKTSAARWADYGDAARAQERLDRFLARASARERADVEALRQSLANQLRAPSPSRAEPAPEAEEPASSAVDRWRKAQIYAARGDDASTAAALALLAEAEKLDPSFARAPELSAAIYERRSQWKDAEAALLRAVRADPSRTTTAESLARLIERDPTRQDESERAWSSAERAGSTEALFHLAQSAERAGHGDRALSLWRRYLVEAPEGLHVAEATEAASRLEGRRRVRDLAGAAVLVLLLGAGGTWILRARTGATVGEWLSQRPGSAPEARRIIGRLRHEALKHGGLLLSDGADRIERGDRETRRVAAALLDERLYGSSRARGLAGEAKESLAGLAGLARADGVRLNLAHRDRNFSLLVRGLRDLSRAKADVHRLAAEGALPHRRLRHAVRRLRRASQFFRLTSGAEIERSVDQVASLPVRMDALQALLSRVAEEARAEAPALHRMAEPESEPPLPAVRVSAADWETLWRNLFANTLGAGRLGLSASPLRDAVTGESRLRIVLCDDLPGRLTTDAVLSRPSDRGLGIVAEILRRNDGSIEVTPPPGPEYTKGVAIELPAVEGPA